MTTTQGPQVRPVGPSDLHKKLKSEPVPVANSSPNFKTENNKDTQSLKIY